MTRDGDARPRRTDHGGRRPAAGGTPAPVAGAAGRPGVGGRAAAAGLPRRPGRPGRLGPAAAAAVPQPHRRADLEHGVAVVVVVTALSAVVGHAGGLVRRADRRPVPPPPRHPRRDPARHPRLRRELRLEGHLPVHRRLLGRRAGHDPGRLSAGLPSGGGQPAAAPTRRRRRWRAASGSAGCETFWTVTVGQARLAIFGGAVLVGLVVLAEFGAFEILGYQTLTTEIYNEFQVGFNSRPPAPSRSFWCSWAHCCWPARARCGATAGRHAGRRRGPRSSGPLPLGGAGRSRWPALASPGRPGAGGPGRGDRLPDVQGGSSTLPARPRCRAPR